jgi:uncharacterized DUF497 family protein
MGEVHKGGLMLKFEWDETKNRINQNKHGISFELASTVFYDQKRIERLDSKHSDNEEKYSIIGCVSGGVWVLFVSYTERREVIRIISARKATKAERREYESSQI